MKSHRIIILSANNGGRKTKIKGFKMNKYLHLMDGTAVMASCEIDGSAELALEVLVNESIGHYFECGHTIEYVSKFDSDFPKSAVVYDILVLDSELDSDKSWGADEIEEAGVFEIQLSSHIFNGHSRVAVYEFVDESEAA
jgi:hypothetical protein